MRRTFARIWRFRPRVLTLLVLFVVAALIALSNLSFDLLGDFGHLSFEEEKKISYGWPWTWRWYTFISLVPGADLDGGALLLGCDSSASGLVGNVAMWIATMAAAAGACEWLLRRYRPRLRWSLRTMLVAIGLVAALWGWFAAARRRADEQDSLIAAINGRVWVERWGPKWLDLIGADRFRRRIVGAQLCLTRFNPRATRAFEENLQRLRSLSSLRYLLIEADHLTVSMAEAFRGMSGLRRLSITQIHRFYDADEDERQISRDCLAAIGTLSRLEHLSLDYITIDNRSLACLAGLTRLKSLRLFHFFNYGGQPLFTRLPALPQLEAIDFMRSELTGADLRRLAVLPRLKVLDLSYADFGPDAGLADLASLKPLEELAIDGNRASAGGLESLAALKRLHALHMDGRHGDSTEQSGLRLDDGNKVSVAKRELGRFRLALQSLRRANPGIVIDLQCVHWFDERNLAWDYEAIPNHEASWLPARDMAYFAGIH